VKTAQPQRGALAVESILRPAVLWLVGSRALTLGVLVYLADRSAMHALLLPQIGFLAAHRWFCVIGGRLPRFIHSLAASNLHCR